MAVADHIAFVALVRARFVRARQEDMRKAGFALVDLCALPIPPNEPKFGLELAADWARRGWQGAIAHTRLRCSPGLRCGHGEAGLPGQAHCSDRLGH